MKTIIELKPIKLSVLNNDEHAQFMTGIINLIEEAQCEPIALEEEVFDYFKQQLNDLTTSVRHSRINEETKKLKEIDKKRNELVVFLMTSFRFFQKDVVEKKREAALTLYEKLKNNLGIQSLPARQKIHAITSLLKDIQEPENYRLIQILGITEAVTSLDKYNQEYQNLLDGRAKNQVKRSLKSAKQIRKEIEDTYKYVMKCAFANNIINKSEENTNFVNLVNKFIEDTMVANKQRLAATTSAKQ